MPPGAERAGAWGAARRRTRAGRAGVGRTNGYRGVRLQRPPTLPSGSPVVGQRHDAAGLGVALRCPFLLEWPDSVGGVAGAGDGCSGRTSKASEAQARRRRAAQPRATRPSTAAGQARRAGGVEWWRGGPSEERSWAGRREAAWRHDVPEGRGGGEDRSAAGRRPTRRWGGWQGCQAGHGLGRAGGGVPVQQGGCGSIAVEDGLGGAAPWGWLPFWPTPNSYPFPVKTGNGPHRWRAARQSVTGPGNQLQRWVTDANIKQAVGIWRWNQSRPARLSLFLSKHRASVGHEATPAGTPHTPVRHRRSRGRPIQATASR